MPLAHWMTFCACLASADNVYSVQCVRFIWLGVHVYSVYNSQPVNLHGTKVFCIDSGKYYWIILCVGKGNLQLYTHALFLSNILYRNQSWPITQCPLIIADCSMSCIWGIPKHYRSFQAIYIRCNGVIRHWPGSMTIKSYRGELCVELQSASLYAWQCMHALYLHR